MPGHETASSVSQPAETFRSDLHPREAQTQTTYDREGEDANHEPDHGSEEEGVWSRSKPEHDAATHADSPQDHEEGPTGGDAENRPLLRFSPTYTCESHADPRPMMIPRAASVESLDVGGRRIQTTTVLHHVRRTVYEPWAMSLVSTTGSPT
jgi:hypothetical protein